MPSRGETWNDEDMATLRQMFLAGQSNAEIARALGRTDASVSTRVAVMKRNHLLGLGRPDER